jgi:hypothetical protein
MIVLHRQLTHLQADERVDGTLCLMIKMLVSGIGLSSNWSSVSSKLSPLGFSTVIVT